MTYRTKTGRRKKRLEIIISILFIAMIFACGILYNYSEGQSLLQATEKVMHMFLNFMLISSIGMVLLFICIFGKRVIRKWRNKN